MTHIEPPNRPPLQEEELRLWQEALEQREREASHGDLGGGILIGSLVCAFACMAIWEKTPEIGVVFESRPTAAVGYEQKAFPREALMETCGIAIDRWLAGERKPWVYIPTPNIPALREAIRLRTPDGPIGF